MPDFDDPVDEVFVAIPCLHCLHPDLNEVIGVVEWHWADLSQGGANQGHQEGLDTEQGVLGFLDRLLSIWIGDDVWLFLLLLVYVVSWYKFALELHEEENHAWNEVAVHNHLVTTHIFHVYYWLLLLLVEALLGIDDFRSHVDRIDVVRAQLNADCRCCARQDIFLKVWLQLGAFDISVGNQSWEYSHGSNVSWSFP